ncbi:DUF4352 domain-containing protein [Spirillospora sp. CA-294931]|uniref:DUF4352 domain-containing protein n=1 Tax=Spirillospora sp. CA-294931 TaxID=3240042 RepID=UPI003D93FF54
MRRATALLVLAGALTAVAPGCSDDGPGSYDNDERKVRSRESPLPHRETRVGEIDYWVMGVSPKFGDVVGNHGSILPKKGQFVRIRLAMENHGRDRHIFRGSWQLLITGDGQAYKPSFDATSVARAPTGPQTLARDERREIDLWYDVPKNVELRSLRVVGDATSSALGEAVKENPPPGTKSADLSLKP